MGKGSMYASNAKKPSKAKPPKKPKVFGLAKGTRKKR